MSISLPFITMTDILFFHSKSARVAPGKGVHEQTSRPYPTLVANPRWREALSNFWVAPFTFTDGYRYNSVEHCFQAQKIALAYPGVPFRECRAFNFTIDSLSPLGLGDGAAAQRERKMVVLKLSELAVWDAQKEEVMAQAQFCKFGQTGVLRDILIATGDAELWHGAARQKPARMLSLERVRAALRAGAKTLPPAGFEADSDSEVDD